MADIYPNPVNITGLDALVSYTTGVEPLLFVGILIVVWIVTFLAAKGYSSSRAFTFASFLVFILSAPIVLMNWLAPRYMYLALVFTCIGWAWMRIGDSYG